MYMSLAARSRLIRPYLPDHKASIVEQLVVATIPYCHKILALLTVATSR